MPNASDNILNEQRPDFSECDESLEFGLPAVAAKQRRLVGATGDRTCDPYHVKAILGLAMLLEK
jgi:hypothetical protein